MALIVPLIRAASVVPMVSWMQANGRPVAARLEAADLGYLPHIDPDRAIPLHSCIALLRDLGRREGPDIGCRMVRATSLRELAMLGRVALSARTPREALQRIALTISRHCTHETFQIAETADALTVQEAWTLPLDDELLHLAQQYVAALIQALCRLVGRHEEMLARVEMVPHPEVGLEHLRPWFGSALLPSRSRDLTMRVERSLAGRPFPFAVRECDGTIAWDDWPVLRGNGSLSASSREVIVSMLENGTPTVQRLATAAGLSTRTYQRRLSEEGTSFSDLLDGVRRDLALRGLATSKGALAELSATLSYGRQSALTRSMRRWTGRPPSQERRTQASSSDGSKGKIK